MRAFKHVNKNREDELSRLFPSLNLYELDDDDSIIKYPISLWDKWYNDVENKENEPPFDCSSDEAKKRYIGLHGIAKDIVNNYQVYALFNGRGGIKQVRCKQQLLKDLSESDYFSRPLLIPSLNAIYSVTWDFTAFIYCKDEKSALPLLEYAYARNFKLISYT